MENFIFFGYDKFNAYLNLAIDEILFENAHKNGNTYVRLYEFEKPALILAYVEHRSDIILDNSDKYDITRRRSNGSVILCDENTLAYSITAPKEAYKDLTNMHNTFGKRIGMSLKEYSGFDDIRVGEHFSVRIGDKTVAGNGQRMGKSIQYHGVLAFAPWDMEKVCEGIALREGEYEFVKSLPGLTDIKSDANMQEFANNLLDSMTQGNFEIIGKKERDEIIEKANHRSNFYRSPQWINCGPHFEIPGSEDKLDKGLGFCFADFIEVERHINKI
jgi:lipoate-protein ligase A